MQAVDRPLEHGAVRRLRGASVELTVGVCLLAFGAYVILCNGFDWDVFLSFNEVDRRSWVLDYRAPLWSYQLCAGVDRIGDPQAFGLSPLFLVVILFGSFWGTKLALLVSAAAGMYFTTRLLALFVEPDARGAVPRAPLLTLAALFITSNFFLWHLLVGHFTFVSFFFGLGIIFYTLEGYLHGLGRKDLLIGSLVAWQHYSGGFFHSTAYLLVPFFVSFGLFAAAAAAGVPGILSATSQARTVLRRMADATAFHLCGLLLASYKLIAVWQHQQENPRILVDPLEINNLGQLFAYQLLPTRGSEWLLPLLRHSRFDLHEYSAFSLLPVALLLLCLRLASARTCARADGVVVRRPRHPLTALVVLYGLLSSTLVLGGYSKYAPFPLLNSLLFQDSVRVVGRFGVGVTLSLAMACALLIRKGVGPGLSRRSCLLLLALSIVNLSTFSWMASLRRTLELASLPYVARREMSGMARIAARYPIGWHQLGVKITSDMYATLRSGIGVINCYNALARPDHRDGWAPGRMHALIDVGFDSPGPQCVEESFFTQNEIHIAASCPPRVCLNIADLNERDPPAGVRYLPDRKRFCRTARHPRG